MKNRRGRQRKRANFIRLLATIYTITLTTTSILWAGEEQRSTRIKRCPSEYPFLLFVWAFFERVNQLHFKAERGILCSRNNNVSFRVSIHPSSGRERAKINLLSSINHFSYSFSTFCNFNGRFGGLSPVLISFSFRFWEVLIDMADSPTTSVRWFCISDRLWSSICVNSSLFYPLNIFLVLEEKRGRS